MSQPKPADVTFSTDWNKIRSWANGQKISTTAVDNVYALDQTRLSSGYYPMSNAERTRAILAAAGMDYNTALPTDNPGPSDVWGNTIRNVQGIATGLMPTRLAGNIFDTLKTTVEDITHPGQFAKNGGIAGALEDSALSWLPGAYDIGQVMKAGSLAKGLDQLAEQPITSVLDVMPALKWLDAGAGAVAADTAAGQALADRLDIAPKALGQKGLVRIAGKAIGQIPTGARGALWDAEGHPILDADGKQIIGQKTLGQRARESALAHGTGHAISRAAEALSTIGNTYSIRYRAIVKDLQTAVAKLTPDTLDPATGAIVKKGTLSMFNEAMHSGQSPEDLLNSHELPLEVKEAIQAYQPWEEWHKEYMLDSGQLIPVHHPDGTVSLYERTTGEKLNRPSHLADQALDKANAASAAVDEINGQASQMEQAFAPLRAEMMNLRNNYLTKLALQPGVSKVYMAVAQRLVGAGGLLDQMDQAFKDRDWVAFREAAKKADKALASKQIAGAPEKVRLVKVAGHKVLTVKKVENAFKAIRSDHVRLFKAESSGIDEEEGWTPSFEAAQREANGGIVYKVDIPRSKLWWMKDDAGDVGGKMSDSDLQDIMAKQKQGLSPEPRAVSLRPPETGVRVQEIKGWEQDPNLRRLKELIHQSYLYGKVRADLVGKYQKAWEGSSETSRASSAKALSEKAGKAVNDFMRAARREVPAEYRDVVLQKFFQNFKDSDKKELMLAKGAEFLKEKGIDEDRIERMVRSDPRRMYELVAALAGPTFEDPFLPMMTPEDHVAFMNDALKEVESLRARGYVPMYVPTTGARFATSPYIVDDRIYVNPVKYPTISAAYRKAMDLSSTVNDVMLGVSKATKEALGKDATLAFWDETLKPMLRAGSELKAAVAREQQALLEHDISATAIGVTDALIEHEYGMVPFKVTELIDLRPEDVGLDPRETYYLPRAMKDQVEQLVGKTQFPLNGIWDKSTKVFKFAILGLSPRYTAHILFGGSMLLALRIDPGSFAMIGDASRLLKDYHAGKLDDQTASVFQGSTQYGTPDQNFHFSGGRSMGNVVMQEWLARHGIDHRVATAAQWAEAAANVNFRFTNYISDMQRAIAYLDGIRKAGRKGYMNDPITGERVRDDGRPGALGRDAGGRAGDGQPAGDDAPRAERGPQGHALLRLDEAHPQVRAHLPRRPPVASDVPLHAGHAEQRHLLERTRREDATPVLSGQPGLSRQRLGHRRPSAGPVPRRRQLRNAVGLDLEPQPDPHRAHRRHRPEHHLRLEHAQPPGRLLRPVRHERGPAGRWVGHGHRAGDPRGRCPRLRPGLVGRGPGHQEGRWRRGAQGHALGARLSVDRPEAQPAADQCQARDRPLQPGQERRAHRLADRRLLDPAHLPRDRPRSPAGRLQHHAPGAVPPVPAGPEGVPRAPAERDDCQPAGAGSVASNPQASVGI